MTLTQVSFDVPGTPVAKGRPRATIRAGRASVYTPAKTEKYENRVALFARQAMAGAEPIDGALRVQIVCEMPIPASWSRKRQQAAEEDRILPAKRPDADNLLKSVTDGSNGILWRDDSQIVELRVWKRYSRTPCVRVDVYRISKEAA